jgi:hypothetical protein
MTALFEQALADPDPWQRMSGATPLAEQVPAGVERNLGLLQALTVGVVRAAG